MNNAEKLTQSEVFKRHSNEVIRIMRDWYKSFEYSHDVAAVFNKDGHCFQVYILKKD